MTGVTVGQQHDQDDEDNDSMRLRVVLLDDDPIMRRAFSRAAQLHGVEVTTAGTEEEAWAALATKRSDVAVLDFHLSEDGGTSAQLARELIESRYLVLIWTGDPESARAAVGKELPILGKSADIGVLFGELARLVRSRALELAASNDDEHR